MKTNIKNGLILGFMALVAFGLKKFYQVAEVPDLQWILLPTKTLVQGFTSLQFSYDPAQGHINTAHQFVIAKSCAGVNFLIIVFCTSVFGFTLRLSQFRQQLLSLPSFLGIAYVLTIAVNAFRIINSLVFSAAQIPGMNASQLHKTEGVIVYLSFLLIYYLTIHYFFQKKFTSKTTQYSPIL